MQRTALAGLICTLLAACSTQPANTASAPATDTTAKAAAAPAESEAARHERIVKTLAAKSIYFDYDNYSVKPQFQALLKQDYELMKDAPKLRVRLEGNADDRGSSEYNLALGQKRAEAVRRVLELSGVPAQQIEAVSYGKERPRATCHEEKCWSENRRVDFAENKP